MTDRIDLIEESVDFEVAAKEPTISLYNVEESNEIMNNHFINDVYTLFVKEGCPWCALAEKTLNENNIAYNTILVGDGENQDHNYQFIGFVVSKGLPFAVPTFYAEDGLGAEYNNCTIRNKEAQEAGSDKYEPCLLNFIDTYKNAHEQVAVVSDSENMALITSSTGMNL